MQLQENGATGRRSSAGIVFIVFAMFVAAACSSDSPTQPEGDPDATEVTVSFRYAAATTTDPAVQAQNPDCVAVVGHTHIHPSWREFVRVDMTESGGAWTISLTDVPVGQELSVRISDPNVCAQNATGAATQNVFANGVLLVRVVPTPGGGGTEPGLAFSVDAFGNVTP